jgi:hypothetical protein
MFAGGGASQEADMGLLDILNTIQSGGDPRARPAPMPAGQSQGMSPIAQALLALLAAMPPRT